MICVTVRRRVKACRNFANKLWNASRFVQMNLPEDFVPGLPDASLLDMSDKWVLTQLNATARDATANLDKYELGMAADKIDELHLGSLLRLVYRDLQGPPERPATSSRPTLPARCWCMC